MQIASTIGWPVDFFKTSSMDWLKGNWGSVAVMIIVILTAYSLWGNGAINETRGKWQAVYYPDGCLHCQENYIFSPFFSTANECINWVHNKATTRNNSPDAAECSFDCEKTKADFGGIQVCKETLEVLGKTQFTTF